MFNYQSTLHLLLNVSKQQLILSDNNGAKLTVTASREALKQLKENIEKEG